MWLSLKMTQIRGLFLTMIKFDTSVSKVCVIINESRKLIDIESVNDSLLGLLSHVRSLTNLPRQYNVFGLKSPKIRKL